MAIASGPARRLVAGLGLLALLGVVVLLAVAVVHRPELVALALVGVAFVVGAALVAATGTRRRRRLALVVAVIGAAVMVVAVADPFSDRSGIGIPVVGAVALGVAAAACARAVRHRPPPAPGRASVARRAVLFVNLGAGGGVPEDGDLAAGARRLGIEVVELGPDDDLEERARGAVAAGAEIIGMAGGDGSVSCVAGVAAEAGVAFVCIPAGTRNHFALDIGLDRRDPVAALGAFAADGEERRIDLARVNGKVFVNNVCLGVYAKVVSDPGYREAKVGTFLAVLADLAERGQHLVPLRFRGPDGETIEEASLVIVSNNPYRRRGLTGGMRRDRLDAGELGVVVLADHGALAVATTAVATAVASGEVAEPVTAWSTTELRVDAPPPAVEVAVDGEAVTLDTPLVFTIEPGVLRLRVPPGTKIGIDEQGSPGLKGAVETMVAAVVDGD